MKALYYKSSFARRQNFQIKTKIVRDENKKFVIKTAIFETGNAHIENIYKNSKILASLGYNIANCKFDKNTVILDFIEGETLGSKILSALIARDKSTVLSLLLGLKHEILLDIPNIDFVKTEEFIKIFGDIDIQNAKSLPISNIDINPDNIVIKDDISYVIDTEWVFDFPIPLDFLIYRNLQYFYTANSPLFNEIMTFTDVLDAFDMKDLKQIDILDAMDKSFANFVHNDGKNMRTINMRYKMADKPIFLEQISEIIQNPQLYIDEIQQKHSQQILEKTSEIESLKAELQYNMDALNSIYSSRSYRFMGYGHKIVSMLVPKGSTRRLIVKISIKAIKNPALFIKKLNPKTIKSFLTNLKRDGVDGVISRIDDVMIKSSLPSLKLSILPEISNLDGVDKLIFPKSSTPKVSIIIPVYNEMCYTYNCLKSILNHSKNISYEIIIANDCSTDDTLLLNNICENIKIITNSTNLRFLKNCNSAAKSAIGEYILFLNNDTQVQESWLYHLIKLAESRDDIGLVGSRFIYPDGRLQEAGGIIWKDASGENYGKFSNPAEPEYNYNKEADYISGAGIMLKRKLWEQIGGFDETFAPAYYEDSDLAFTIREMGLKVMLAAKSNIIHFEGISNGTDLNHGQKAYQVTNHTKFQEKWAKSLEKNHVDKDTQKFLARDRSQNSKTILVIDHYVPTYDKDAGSRTMMQYLKLFVEMGFNVKFMGDNFAKQEPYSSEIEELGIEILAGRYYANNWKNFISENSSYIDYVYLNRPHIAEKYIDYIKDNTKAKILYNVCDLHFVREEKQYLETKDKNLISSVKRWQKLETSLMQKSDYVLTLSCDELSIINDLFPEKGVLVPIFILEEFNCLDFKDIDKKSDILFVGGFRHTPNLDGINWFLDNIFHKLSDLNLKLYIAGSNPPKDLLDKASDNIIVTGFISDEELDALYKKCQIAIVPLTYGAGVKGKTIEAMHKNISIVSTQTGTEGLQNIQKYIQTSKNAEIFEKSIRDLYNNSKAQSTQISGFNEFLQDNFSKDIAIQTFSKILK